jgi:hypothetical protein
MIKLGSVPWISEIFLTTHKQQQRDKKEKAFSTSCKTKLNEENVQAGMKWKLLTSDTRCRMKSYKIYRQR